MQHVAVGMAHLDLALFEVGNEDAIWPAGQQTLQVGLAHRERQAPQVVAIHGQHVERDQLDLVVVSVGMQGVEVGIAVDAADDGLTIDHKMALPIPARGLDNARVALRPVVPALGDQPHAITVALQAEPSYLIS